MKFQKSRKTELCLAHYRVPRGLGLVTCCDVVWGTRIHDILCLSIDFLLHECELSEVSTRTLGIMPARCVTENCGNVKENIDCGPRNYVTAQVTFQLVPGPCLLGTGPNDRHIQWVVKNSGFNQTPPFFLTEVL